MVCCLTAPSHYMKRCDVHVSSVKCSGIQPSELSLEMPKISIIRICHKRAPFQLSLRDQWVKQMRRNLSHSQQTASMYPFQIIHYTIHCRVYWVIVVYLPWPQFYQTRSAWSMDQGSTKKRSAVHNFVPTVTKFCVMWEGLSLPYDTKFGNCRGAIVDRRVIFIWSLIHGSSWTGLIKVGPGG